MTSNMENSSSKNKIINSTNDVENSIMNNSNITIQKKSKLPLSKTKDQVKLNKGTKSEDKKNNDDDDDDFVLPVKTIKRSNSIKLYKRHQKDKQRRESLKKESIKELKNEDIYNSIPDNNGSNRTLKTTKKKVEFLPNFVTIIDVESYKKFNAENTCKDPFEDADFLNGNINLINNDEEVEGKTRLNCSCFIF